MSILIINLMLFLGLNTVTSELALRDVRVKFHSSTNDESLCKKLITMLEPYNENNHPLYYGYRGCANMVMAKHVFNPITKLSYFKKGKKILENAIQHDKSNIELRFLRYSIQTNVPSFLGYNGNIKADRSFLQQSVKSMNDAELKKIISSYLKEKTTD